MRSLLLAIKDAGKTKRKLTNVLNCVHDYTRVNFFVWGEGGRAFSKIFIRHQLMADLYTKYMNASFK